MSRFGFGGGDGDGRRNGRDGPRGGYDELGYERSYDGRRFDFEEVGEFRFDNPVHDRPRGRAGEALRHNQLEQLLMHETAAAGGSLEKPYLSSVPKEYAAERVVFDWLEFLVLKGGFKRTMDALRYYLSVDWITEDVETELHDYLIGFSGNVSNTTEFDVDDHHLSLVHVARLASMAGRSDEESPRQGRSPSL
ncbi:FlaD/FlaE family flagellar protein [Halogeometricum limi]|uniref:FlaD/FlaE family flagellar protein n=1 Tax=Halogeometricum limi TaxID=555875 RepID=UPI00373FDE3F